jgi:hypothetical protein
VALFVQLILQIATAALWELPINRYSSNLIVGFNPNLWNSLTMIALTSSAFSAVVMIESWIVAMNVPGSSSRMRRQMTSIMILDS